MSIKGLHRPGNGNGGCVYDVENSSVLMERLAQRGLRPRSQTQDPDLGPRTPGFPASPVLSVHLPVQVYFIFFSIFDVLKSH